MPVNLLHQPASKFLLGSAPTQLVPELLERVFLHILFYRSPKWTKSACHTCNKATDDREGAGSCSDGSKVQLTLVWVYS